MSSCSALSAAVGSVGVLRALACLAEWSSVKGSAGGSGCSVKLKRVIPFQSSANSLSAVESDHESFIQESLSGIPLSSNSKMSVVLSGPRSCSAGP